MFERGQVRFGMLDRQDWTHAMNLYKESRRKPSRAALAALLLVAAQGLSLTLVAQTPTPPPAQDERGLVVKPSDPSKPSASAQTAAAGARPELVLQTGHANFVTGLMNLTFSADGRLLASTSVN